MANDIRKQKIILILVEGGSDRFAFMPLEGFIKKTNEEFKEFYKIHIEAIGGDVTTKKYNSFDKPNSFANRLDMIVFEIAGIVESFIDAHKLTIDDIAEVVQIVDMDGAYVPTECIKPMTETEKQFPQKNELLYYDDSIHSLNYAEYPKGPHYRNKIKRVSLDHLVDYINAIVVSKNGEKKEIPYKVFFTSCNLDHFFYGDRNLDPRLKINKAKELARLYSGSKAIRYVELFERIKMPEMKDYIESWNYIRQRNMNSLKRCSNSLLINDLCKELVDCVSREKQNG